MSTDAKICLAGFVVGVLAAVVGVGYGQVVCDAAC